MFVIDLPDLHFDKLAWGKETGKDWDMKISSSLYMKAIDDLVSKASVYSVEKILYPVGNDMFNSDTIDNTTTKGTKQIVDGRWKKSFVLARKLIVSAALKLSKIAPVDIMIVPGNHDEQKTFYLGDALECRFYNDANVNVDNTPTMRKYFKYGKTLIAYTHGKDEK
ncbi:MAG: hypothetical protein IPL84_03900 [Chitinophagaceae bacterium]|nr:hypothetical protein [Chitinophagaceae bacterium]